MLSTGHTVAKDSLLIVKLAFDTQRFAGCKPVILLRRKFRADVVVFALLKKVLSLPEMRSRLAEATEYGEYAE